MDFAANVRLPMSPSQTPKIKIIFFLLVILALLSGCDILLDIPTPLPVEVVTPGETSTSWYSVYFTDPTGPAAEYYEGGPDEAVAAAIDAARLSVDVAVYDFNLSSIRDALIHAYQRGVAVRMVMESDNMDEPEVEDLKKAGIEIVTDRREGYMHDKFVVIDRLEVWTGSMNFTTNDAYRNNNNYIRIRSSKMAEDYTTEFEEMFIEDLFSTDKRAANPNPTFTVEGTRLEVYFSPDDGVAAHIVELIQSAQHSIYFLAFSFTSDDIAEAILERAAAGVDVAGVFEKSQVASNTGDEYDALLNAGLDVRLDGNSRNMHSKVFIIDRQIVITGSYNFSANAEKSNDENIVVIYNADIAALYTAEFQKVLGQAKQP